MNLKHSFWFLLSFKSLFLVMPAVIIRQRKAIRRKNGVFIYFEGIVDSSVVTDIRRQFSHIAAFST